MCYGLSQVSTVDSMHRQCLCYRVPVSRANTWLGHISSLVRKQSKKIASSLAQERQVPRERVRPRCQPRHSLKPCSALLLLTAVDHGGKLENFYNLPTERKTLILFVFQTLTCVEVENNLS